MLLTARWACCDSGLGTADIEEAPHPNPLPQAGEGKGNAQPSLEQSRGVIPFSLAYFAADSSIMGLTIDWSEAIQSVIVFHFAPSHCRNFTDPPPSWSMQDTFSACMKPVAPSCFSFLSSMLRFSRPQRTWSPVIGLPLPYLSWAVRIASVVTMPKTTPRL